MRERNHKFGHASLLLIILYIADCTEMHLSRKNISKIRGFEDFVSLEALDLSHNRLEKLNNLDITRLKRVYAHDNLICTLKGSLLNWKFLEILDLGNNRLKDLSKQVAVLSKLLYLRNLNLKGNPLCEEPDYRLFVIHSLPGLETLDMHTITDGERQKAKIYIGGSVNALTVAFGQRIPPRTLSDMMNSTANGENMTERELAEEAARVREQRIQQEAEAEAKLYALNPHPEIIRGTRLPPNAGTLKAMAKIERQKEEASYARSRAQKKVEVDLSSHGDVYILSTLKPNPNHELAKAGTALVHLPPGHGDGPIQFERQKYEAFVEKKVVGDGNWLVVKSELSL